MSLADYFRKEVTRNEGIIQAYASGGYSMKETGEHFGLHYSQVSRIIKGFRNAKCKTG
ncbi:MAG TPA: helix-turn-helix domain-containing protein [Gammaproteobacteria bacterium]|nr:helix-turn-helix domain-containing protein [Gammaproteobacteria bacterium]